MRVANSATDKENTEYYLARPFNFNLTPLSADGIDLRLDRQFTFSTSACDFLSKNGFDFGKVFKEGIPYLSRDEEDERREEYVQRAVKNAAIPDLVIPLEDATTINFIRNARKTIAAWAKDNKVCLWYMASWHPADNRRRNMTFATSATMPDP